MRRMVRAATTAPPSVQAPTPPVETHRRLLPSVPHTQTPTGTKRKTPPPLASQRRRRRLDETPKRTVPKKPSRLPVPTPSTTSRIPVPITPSTQKKKTITPLDLTQVQLKPTPATQKKKSSPHHLKASITPEALTQQSTKLKKVGPPRTTRQINPLMVSLAQEIDKRRRALDPEHQSTGELKGLAKQWKAWK